MFKRRNRAWVAVLLAGALVAGLATQAFATPVRPDRPTGLTADLDDGGVLLSWDAPDEAVDSWQVWRKIRPAETAHTVIATVDGELNEWTDTDLTAGDRRYKVAAVRDSLTSRRSRVAKLVLDEPPPPLPLRPTPSTITQVPEKEPLTEKDAGDTCTPATNIVTATVGTAKVLTGDEDWVKVALTDGVGYEIYFDPAATDSTTTVRIDFVCGPDKLEIGNTGANAGTGLSSLDASLDFRASAAGFHYVKITATSGATVLVSDLSDDDLEPIVAVGASGTGTILSPTDRGGANVVMVSGTSYQIDVESVGYPGIDPWIVDIWDGSGPITRTGECDYTNTPPGPTGLHHLLRGVLRRLLRLRLRPRQRGAGHLHRDQDRRTLDRGRQPRRMANEAGRLAPDSDRGACPVLRRVLRRLRGGHLHHGHRGCGRLCVGPD